ncbi:hypothetical protein MMC17_007800 [Xylographa soralifera]|nr:hypothetical protein [Xylographa soralifera]
MLSDQNNVVATTKISIDADPMMSVSERRRLFEVQNRRALDAKISLSAPRGLASPRVALSNTEHLSPSPGHTASLRSSPVVRKDGQNSSEEEDADRTLNGFDDTLSLLKAPALPERSYSSNGRLQQSNVRPPPPVPSKSNAIMHRFNTSQSVTAPRWSHPEFLRTQSTNLPPLDDEYRSYISMVDNDLEQGEGHSPSKHAWLENEVQSPANDEPKDPLQHVFRQATNFSSRMFGNVQNFVTTVPPKPPKPAELGQKISQTVNPLLSGAKENLGKVVLVAKPVVTEVGRGLDGVRVRAQTVLDKTGVSKVFGETQDDLSDAAARLTGKDGLCSKCRTLPADLCLSNQATVTLGSEREWATPLSRIIYHADWCRVCHLLLNMLCESGNDPLKHPAVAPYVQDEVTGWTMRDWIMAGWEFTDEHWPFGHGEKRLEGASYVLGPSGQTLGVLFGRAGRLAASYGVRTAINPRRTFKDVSRDQRHRERLKLEREKQSRYPLSCVVKITARTQPGTPMPGMLFVNLFGYGRKVGADLHILSSFRLRAISSTSSSAVDNLLSSRTTGSFSYGKLLDPDWIDPSIGRLWLRECESRHGSECNEHGFAIAMQKPGFLRVIDVEEFCVKEVANPAECRFIALSYVWGGAKMVKLQHTNMDALMRKNGLLQFMHALPQTIVDAIEVVHAMGERHLWNDSLCILQDDAKEAKEQIACMDRVYGSALATIVAAQGKTAHSGLDGVRQSHVPKIAQRPEKKRSLHQIAAAVKDDISLIAPLTTTDHNVDASAWNARAWTFQERLLSRRIIVFTHGQIIWHCRKMICREDMTVEDSNVPYARLQWLSLKPRYLGVDTGRDWIDGSVEITRHGATQLVRSATFAEYVKAVEQYTHRQMSYQSDILNASAGLMHIFSLCFKSRIFFGLPEGVLDVALLWQPTQQLTRRIEFPSWSWSGWVGQVTYEKPFRITRGVDGKFVSFAQEACGEEGIRPLIRWHVWDALSHRTVSLNRNGLGFPFESAALPKEWEDGPYFFDERGNGGPRTAPTVPTQFPSISKAEQCLFFWASSSTSFRFGKAIIQESDQRWNVANAPRRYLLLDAESEVIGNVLLDGADDKWLACGRHEFIQIAEAQYSGLDNEVRDIEDCPLYLVMLIEWNEQRSIAYRLGLGRVQKTAWMLAGPKLKLVCLG